MYRLFLTLSILIILSCKKDESSSSPTTPGTGGNGDWTISTSSTFSLKDSLGLIYVNDNKNDESFEATAILSKIANKNNLKLQGEFQFVIDYNGESSLNISEPISFVHADFSGKESIEKKVTIKIPGSYSKIGIIKMKMREKLNTEWTAYKYADKVYPTAYHKAVVPSIEGPEQLDIEASYKILNAATVVLENAKEIANLTKVSETEYKVTKIGTAYGKVILKATNKDQVSVTKEITVGVPLPTINGPDLVDNEATYTFSNTSTAVLENSDKIASITKISDTQYKVTKIGTAYGKVTIKATNKLGVSVTKEITVGVALPTITGADIVETEATFTVANATTVVLENATNIATLTKLSDTQYKVTKIGTAYGKVTIKATNKAGASTTKVITVGVALPTITGVDIVETDATFVVANATTVVLENAANIATLTKVSNTQYKITKIGTAYGKVKIKATNKLGVSVTKEITVGVPLPTITGSDIVETEATFIVANATTVVLENATNIATLTKISDTQYKVTKIGTAYGKVTIKATNKAGASVTKTITVGIAPLPAPTISGSETVCTEEIYTITNATDVIINSRDGYGNATLINLGNNQWKLQRKTAGYVNIIATNKDNIQTGKIVKIGLADYNIKGGIEIVGSNSINTMYFCEIMNGLNELNGVHTITWFIKSENSLRPIKIIKGAIEEGAGTSRISFQISGDNIARTLVTIEAYVESYCGDIFLTGDSIYIDGR